MSYATHLFGSFKIHGVPRDMAEKLRDALESARRGEKGNDPEIKSPLDFETEWRQVKSSFTNEMEDVELYDFVLDRAGKTLLIVGVPYEGGTRNNLLHQLNWIMAWIAESAPEASFAGRIEEHDGEGECFPPTWFEPDGGVAREYQTKIVKVEHAGLPSNVKWDKRATN